MGPENLYIPLIGGDSQDLHNDLSSFYFVDPDRTDSIWNYPV